MTNKWYDVKKKLPKVSGKYLVKLRFDDKTDKVEETVDILYWNAETATWVEHKAMFIFKAFKVYETIKKPDSNDEALSPVEARPYVYFNDCVIAWKKLPK